MSIGRRADVGTPVLRSVIRMDGARSVARRVRFVHRRRTDRIETAEERKDWIFVLDVAESMAETVMVQRKKIKTVTWTAFAPVFTGPVRRHSKNCQIDSSFLILRMLVRGRFSSLAE